MERIREGKKSLRGCSWQSKQVEKLKNGENSRVQWSMQRVGRDLPGCCPSAVPIPGMIWEPMLSFASLAPVSSCVKWNVWSRDSLKSLSIIKSWGLESPWIILSVLEEAFKIYSHQPCHKGEWPRNSNIFQHFKNNKILSLPTKGSQYMVT